MEDSDLSAAHDGMPPRRRLLPALVKGLVPLVLIGGTAAVLLVLHLNGTLRAFLDRQSMLGMMLVVLVVNAVGFSFVYMISVAWKAVKRDLGRDDDW